MTEPRRCRVCSGPIIGPEYWWACSGCYRARRRAKPTASPASELLQRPGQLSIYDLLDPEPEAEAEERSAYIEYENARARLRGVA